ncbi:hypothetical protein LXL04_036692 [Taraxacum kok-saghyz]
MMRNGTGTGPNRTGPALKPEPKSNGGTGTVPNKRNQEKAPVVAKAAAKKAEYGIVLKQLIFVLLGIEMIKANNLDVMSFLNQV